MSAQSLYRIMVRMLYDPAFVDLVYGDCDRAMRDEDLTAEESAYLLRPDRRAWDTDPLRRLRSLTGLVEEFPASSAFALRKGLEGVVHPDRSLLDAFFSSESFHRSVQDGQSMVFAFGQYLQSTVRWNVVADPRTSVLARIETEVAAVRRDAGTRLPGTTGSGLNREIASEGIPQQNSSISLAPSMRILKLPSGSQEIYSRIAKSIKASGLGTTEAVFATRWSLPVLLLLDPEQVEYVIVEQRRHADSAGITGDIGVTTVTLELGTLLEHAAEDGYDWESLVLEIRSRGASRGEDEEIARSLLDEGFLIVSSHAP